MKKIQRFLFLGFILAAMLMFYQCDQDSNKTTHQDLTTESINGDVKSSGSGMIIIDCVGNCDDGGDECYVRVMPGVIRCSCEGCAMQVTTKPSGRNVISKLDMPKIYTHFLGYIKETYGIDEHRVLKYTQTIEKEYELIEFVFTVSNSDEKLSLVYYNNFTKDSGTVLVDCSGSCDDANEKCVEYYNAGTGEVYCGCEGDNCKMTVQRID